MKPASHADRPGTVQWFAAGVVGGGGLGFAAGTPLTIFLVSWALAATRSPLGQPPGSWLVLFGFAASWVLASALAARRTKTLLRGALLGAGLGLFAGLLAVFAAVLIFRAGHPAGFYVG